MSVIHKKTNVVIYVLVGGVNPSGTFLVNWDDYFRYMEKIKMLQTNNQYVCINIICKKKMEELHQCGEDHGPGGRRLELGF